jgi:hypothetical protein
MLTAGDIRKLIDGKPDDFEVPIYMGYNDVDNEYIFVRLDDASTTPSGNTHKAVDEPDGICLTLSLVDSENSDPGNDEDEEPT